MKNLIFVLFFFFDGNLINHNYGYRNINIVTKLNYFRGDIKMRGIKNRFVTSHRFVFHLIKYEERIKM